MKRNTLAKKLTAVLLTGAMVMSMGGMTAFAANEGGENTGSEGTASITKVLNKPSNVLTPKTSFEFNITYDRELTGVTGIITEDVSTAVTFQNNDNIISANADEAKDTTTSLTYSETLPLEVNLSKYSKPGVYRYNVTEIISEDTNKYEGIDYDENTLLKLPTPIRCIEP